MTENIRDIFEHNIRLLGSLNKAVYYFREQQHDKALGIVADVVEQINYTVEAIITDRDYFNLVATESILEMLTGILEAKKNQDFILLADLLELQLISFLCGVQELIISKEEIQFDEENYLSNLCMLMHSGQNFPDLTREPLNPSKLLEGGYRVEFTSCGLMTLAAENEGAKFYFHTNNQIQAEAFLLARHWLHKETKRYIIYGFGMGYHIQELMELAPDAEFIIYEADRNVLQLACAFADVKRLLLEERVHVIYDMDLIMLREKLSALTQEEVFFIHYPSYKNYRGSNKDLLESYIPWSKTIESC